MTTNQDRAVEVMRNFWHDGRYAVGFDEIADALADAGLLTPDPQPRTLADTKWDDNVHPYMEAVTVSGRRHILLAPMGETAVSENTILVAEHDGGMPVLVPAEDLFPTGRYARLSLPEEQATEEAPEEEEGTYGKPFWEMVTKAIRDEKEYHIDAQDYEGVKRWRDTERALHTAMETNPPKGSPVPARPEDVPEGEVWIVECYGDRHVGTRDPNEAPNWALARMDGLDTTFAGDELVDLVTRLVPEVKA